MLLKLKKKEEEAEIDEQQLLMVSTVQDDPKVQHWFMDSGASNHMTGKLDYFIEINNDFKVIVRMGDKKELKVEGKGTVIMYMENDKFKILENVYYAPSLEYNLLSVGQFMRRGYSLLFDDGYCSVRSKKSGNVVIRAPLATNNMFVVDTSCMLSVHDSSSNKADIEGLKWHLRFGHLHVGGLKQLYKKNMVMGISKVTDNITCETCVACKQTRLPFKGTNTHARKRLELIHTDLCGPMQVPSLGNNLYYLLFIDDLT